MSCARDWVIITGHDGRERFAWCRCCGVLREPVVNEYARTRRYKYYVPRREAFGRKAERIKRTVDLP